MHQKYSTECRNSEQRTVAILGQLLVAHVYLRSREALNWRYLGAADVTNTRITECSGLGFCVWVPLAADAPFRNLVKRRG